MPTSHLAVLLPDPATRATARGPRNAARPHATDNEPSFAQALADTRHTPAPDCPAHLPASKPAQRTGTDAARARAAQHAKGDATAEAKGAARQEAEPCAKDCATNPDVMPSSLTFAPEATHPGIEMASAQPPATPAAPEAAPIATPDLATASTPALVLAAHSATMSPAIRAAGHTADAQTASLPSQPDKGMWSGQSGAGHITMRHGPADQAGAQTEGDAPQDGTKGDAKARDAATIPASIPASTAADPGTTHLSFAAHLAPLAASQASPITAQVAVPQPVPLAHVPVTIATMASEGARQFDIRLDPPNLGRIDVTLAVDAEGAIRTHIAVERPETLQLLRNDAHRLDQALSDAGLISDPAGPAFSLRNSNDDARHRTPRHDHAAGAPHAAPGTSDSAQPTLPAPRRLMSAASRLDLTL